MTFVNVRSNLFIFCLQMAKRSNPYQHLLGPDNVQKCQILVWHDLNMYTVAVYSWSIANNFVIYVYYRYLEILCQIALSSIANYFRSDSLLQFGIKSIGIYSRHQ